MKKKPNGSKRLDVNGYVKIKVDGKWIQEHRYVFEQIYKVSLSSSQIINHIDHNKRNNDISNLTLLTRAEHKQEHSSIGRSTRFKKGQRVNIGESNGMAKLNFRKAQLMRWLHKEFGWNVRSIASLVNTSVSNAYKVILYNQFKYEK